MLLWLLEFSKALRVCWRAYSTGPNKLPSHVEAAPRCNVLEGCSTLKLGGENYAAMLQATHGSGFGSCSAVLPG